jgi:hypothetical protein
MLADGRRPAPRLRTYALGPGSAFPANPNLLGYGVIARAFEAAVP